MGLGDRSGWRVEEHVLGRGGFVGVVTAGAAAAVTVSAELRRFDREDPATLRSVVLDPPQAAVVGETVGQCVQEIAGHLRVDAVALKAHRGVDLVELVAGQ